MAARRVLPERDILEVLLRSGQTAASIARTYGTSRAAVSAALGRSGLTNLGHRAAARSDHATFIPWKRKLEHDRQYALVCLRFYIRSLGVGAPLENALLDAKAAEGTLTASEKITRDALRWRRNQMGLFTAELDRERAVVDYAYETGFIFVPAKPGDKHYVRWPKDVPDHRDDVLERLRG